MKSAVATTRDLIEYWIYRYTSSKGQYKQSNTKQWCAFLFEGYLHTGKKTSNIIVYKQVIKANDKILFVSPQ